MKTETRISTAFICITLFLSSICSIGAQVVPESNNTTPGEMIALENDSTSPVEQMDCEKESKKPFALVELGKESSDPGKILENLLILPSGWISRIPPQGPVNAPGHLNTIAPGQRFALALVAKGTDRDALFSGVAIDLKLVSSAGTSETHNLQPVAIRRIKASGTDFVMKMIQTAGIAKDEQGRLTELTSLTTLAIFEPDWTAPDVDVQEIIQIAVTVAGSQTPSPSISPATLTLRPWKDWLGDALPDEDDLEELMATFHNAPQPGRLPAMLKSAVRADILEHPPENSFFAVAFREHEYARKAVLDIYPSLELMDKWAFLLTMRLDGQDVSKLMRELPKDVRKALSDVKPLQSPDKLKALFRGSATVEKVRNLGIRMDECWGGWIATGNPDYLRPLVLLLDAADDFPVFQKWMNARKGAEGLNARVLRGMAYKIAGWSLSSFQRSDPHVADWLLYWENDANMSSTVRSQIASLSDNPAFEETP
jgi:hypothetical protein